MSKRTNLAHIIFAVDKNYAPFIVPILYQLHKFKTKCNSIIIVVAKDVDLSTKDLLISKGNSYGFKLEIVETDILDKLRQNKIIKDRTHVSYFTYVKLFLPKILPSIDQILYLDVDILIREPINDLLNWELNSPVGAIAEFGSNGKLLFKSNRHQYFNAGILRMSLNKCRQISLSDNAEKILMEADRHFEFQDQDVLNLLLKNQIYALPNTFNVFHENTMQASKMATFSNPVIVHFNGPDKPWKRETKSHYVQEWRSDFKKSGGNLKLLGIKESAQTPQFDYAILLSKIRFSPIGKLLRRRLPYFLKKPLNDLIYQFYKLLKKNDPIFLEALFSQEAICKESLRSESTVSLIEERLDEATNLPISRGKFSERNSENLTFIVSQARSGTNAFQEFVSALNSTFIMAGEIFLGEEFKLHETAGKAKSYPKLERFEWDKMKIELKEESKIHEAFELHQQFNDLQAFNILNYLINNTAISKNMIFIKIFPEQISTEKFNEILRIYRPRIIVLKRRMLFSLVSELKARVSGSFRLKDNSDLEIMLNQKEVAGYISRTDGWFNNIDREISRLEIPSITITYEGFFESGEDVDRVKNFISESADVEFQVNLEAVRLPIQDRRTDQSLTSIFSQFTHFPRSLQTNFIRHPGNLFSKSEDISVDSGGSGTPSGLIVNFLHITKCAGTEIARYIQVLNNTSSNISIRKHWHDVNLNDIPETEGYFFSIREPITRFVSEFYSRKKQGRPRYNNPWSFHETAAFAHFPHANLLAESLFLSNLEGEQAHNAMKSIGFVWKNQVDWFSQQENFLKLRPPLYIIRQENFHTDLSILLRKLGFENNPYLEQDTTLSHMNDYSDAPPLSDLAIANLKLWFKQDIDFYKVCSDWIEENCSS